MNVKGLGQRTHEHRSQFVIADIIDGKNPCSFETFT